MPIKKIIFSEIENVKAESFFQVKSKLSLSDSELSARTRELEKDPSVKGSITRSVSLSSSRLCRFFSPPTHGYSPSDQATRARFFISSSSFSSLSSSSLSSLSSLSSSASWIENQRGSVQENTTSRRYTC